MSNVLYFQVDLHDGRSVSIPILQERLIIGRNRRCDIVLNDPCVSRVHLVVVRTAEDTLVATDLRTANGTTLDSIPMIPAEPLEWKPGQVAVIGNTQLRLERRSEINTSDEHKPNLEKNGRDSADRFDSLPDSRADNQTRQETAFGGPNSLGREQQAGDIAPTLSHQRGFVRSRSHIPDRASVVASLLFLAYLNVAEVLTFYGDTLWGLVLYSAVLLILLCYVADHWRDRVSSLLLGLAIVPVIRLLDLSLPLVNLLPSYRLLILGVPLMAAALLIIRLIPLSLKEIGFNSGQVSTQMLIGATGVILGIVIYLLVKPVPLVPSSEWTQSTVITVVSFFGIGLIEELIFRGLIQKTAVDSLGTLGGIFYVSALYAVLQIGHNAMLYVFPVFGVALFYSWVVLRTSSIVGVAISHGLINLVLLVLMPTLLGGGAV